MQVRHWNGYGTVDQLFFTIHSFALCYGSMPNRLTCFVDLDPTYDDVP